MTLAKEKPILFSTEMVRAILAGRKTQTRRVMKPQPDSPIYKLPGRSEWFFGRCKENNYTDTIVKPRYQKGDILWIRETWGDNGERIFYKADSADTSKMYGGWKPSIHMPRAAARIFLRVADVRVERLQEISEDDAIAEGCKYDWDGNDWRTFYTIDKKTPINSSRAKFGSLWNKINAKRSYGWGVNPWIWVYTFEQTQEGQA